MFSTDDEEKFVPGLDYAKLPEPGEALAHNPIRVPQPNELVHSPGFFESFLREAMSTEAVANIAKSSYRLFQNSAFDANQSDDWSAFNPDLLAQYPQAYWEQLLSATSAQDQQIIAQQLDEDIANREILENGNGIGRFLGGATALVFDVVVADRFLGAAVGAAMNARLQAATSLGKGFLGSAARTVPAAAGFSGLYNSTKLLADRTYQLDDWAVQTAVETGFASILAGLGGSAEAFALKKQMSVMNLSAKGVEFKPKIGADGKLDGLVAEATDGSVSAAEVDLAQTYANEAYASYAGKKYLDKVFKVTPLMRGLNSPFGVIRNYTKNIFNTSGIITDDAAITQSAEQLIKYYTGQTAFLHRAINAAWEKQAGISGFNKDTKDFIQNKFLRQDYYTREQFAKEVTKALRNGGNHENADVMQAAAITRKTYDEMYNKAVDLNLLPAGLESRVADAYLNRMYAKNVMAFKEDAFVDAVSQEIKRISDEIEQLQIRYADDADGLLQAINRGEIEELLIDRPVLLNEKEVNTLKSLYEEREIASKDPAALEKFENDLVERFNRGEISDRIAYLNDKSTRLILSELDRLPKLRSTVKSLEEAQRIAKSAYDTIMHLHPEDIHSDIISSFSSASASSSSLKSRTLRVRDEVIEPFLEDNIYTLSSAYIHSMGRVIGREQAFRNMGYSSSGDALRTISTALKAQYELDKAPILKSLESKDAKVLKEAKAKKAALDKSFDEARDFLENSYGVLNGTLDRKHSDKSRAFFKALRQYTVMTALGGLPLLQVAESGSLLRQYQFFELFSKGLVPMVQSVFHGKEFLHAQEDMAHMNLAINTTIAAYARAWEGRGAVDLERGWLSSGLNAMGRFFDVGSQKFMNITGANPIQDTLQHLSGVKAQSNTIDTLYKLKKGEKLTRKEHERLVLNGLNASQYRDRILNQFEKYGEVDAYKNGTAYISNYHLWDDYDAKAALLSSIRREVDSIILTPNYLDVPFAFRGPIAQSITMFMNYGMAATNQRLLPTMQRLDADRVKAEIAVAALSMYVSPMRDYLYGREVDTSPRALIGGMVTNSGYLGFPLEMFNRANALLDIPYLNAFKNNRYDTRGVSGLLAGAPGSAIESFINIVNDLSSGKISQQTAKNIMKSAVPGMSAWYARPLSNYIAEQSGLPEKRSQAKEWFPDSDQWLNSLDEW